MKKFISNINFVICILLIYSCNNVATDINTHQQVINLRAFAKLYGYIRFFHPSQQASEINWEKFALYGIDKIKNADSQQNLEKLLTQLFSPIAPSFKIYSINRETVTKTDTFLIKNDSLKTISWQHLGIELYDKPSVYKSIRTKIGSNIIDKRRVVSYNINGVIKSDNSIHSYRLFKEHPQIGELFTANIAPSLVCTFPLTVIEDSIKKVTNYKRSLFVTLQEELSSLDLRDMNTEDQNVRLANVIIAWNIFQHFYPYFDIVRINWDDALTESLYEALQVRNSDEFYYTLSKMVAKLSDGHGGVFYKMKQKQGGLPIRVEWIENKAVITATNDTIFKNGDIIYSVDGVKISDRLSETKKIISGSEQLKIFRAMQMLFMGPLESKINIGIIRGDRFTTIVTRRISSKEIAFFDFRTIAPGIKKLDGNIYYINLLTVKRKDFLDSLNQLSESNGIIFDWRWEGGRLNTVSELLNTREIIPYLIKSPVSSPKFLIPCIVYPDRKDISFLETPWEPIKPLQPYLNAKIIFIVDARVISYGETIMSIIENYKLGELVGEPTAGTNGNANYFNLLGGYEIMFTGMKVLKHDGSQHHLIGIKPAYPVQRTIKAVKEGRDEYLEKALEVIKNSSK